MIFDIGVIIVEIIPVSKKLAEKDFKKSAFYYISSCLIAVLYKNSKVN